MEFEIPRFEWQRWAIPAGILIVALIIIVLLPKGGPLSVWIDSTQLKFGSNTQLSVEVSNSFFERADIQVDVVPSSPVIYVTAQTPTRAINVTRGDSRRFIFSVAALALPDALEGDYHITIRARIGAKELTHTIRLRVEK